MSPGSLVSSRGPVLPPCPQCGTDGAVLPPVRLNLRLGLSGQLGVGVSNLAPGEEAERPVTLINVGSAPIAAVALSAQLSSPSVSPLASALEVGFTACSVPWRSTTVQGYACPGTTRTVVSPASLASLAARSVVLAGVTLAPGQRAWLLERVVLPASAGNAVAGNAVAASWTFTATGP